MVSFNFLIICISFKVDLIVKVVCFRQKYFVGDTVYFILCHIRRHIISDSLTVCAAKFDPWVKVTARFLHCESMFFPLHLVVCGIILFIEAGGLYALKRY